MSREDLVRAYQDLTGSVDKLRVLVDDAEKRMSDADRGRMKLTKAVDLALDIVDSKSWMSLADDAKEDAKEERKARLAAVNEIVEYMGMLHENNDPMLDRYGILGWKLINWSWSVRSTLAATEESFCKLHKETDAYVKEIVGLKGQLGKTSVAAEKIADDNDTWEAKYKKEHAEKEKLYEETKRLKDARIWIDKAEARARRSEREAGEQVDAAKAETVKAREETAKIRQANIDLAKARDAEIKYLNERLANAVNERNDSVEKTGRKVTRLEAKVKKQREDIKFYEDLLTKSGVAYEQRVVEQDDPGEKEETKEG